MALRAEHPFVLEAGHLVDAPRQRQDLARACVRPGRGDIRRMHLAGGVLLETERLFRRTKAHGARRRGAEAILPCRDKEYRVMSDGYFREAPVPVNLRTAVGGDAKQYRLRTPVQQTVRELAGDFPLGL